MHETNVLPIGTITLKGRWRRCKWEEPSHQARSYVSVHDAVNRAAQRIQRFFLVVHAKLTVASLRVETIGHKRRTDPLTLVFMFASKAVTADYEGRVVDACELYDQAVCAFVAVERERWVAKKYVTVFSMRMKELRRAVDIENAVLCAEQGVLRVQQDIARLKEAMGLQARLLAAREEQRHLRRAARKERKRHRYRTARTARKEQLQFQREQLTTQLDGGWMALGPDGASEGTVFFRDLDVYASGLDHVYASGSDHVYASGSDPLFLCFIEVDSDGFLVYEYDDGERVLARLVGVTLTWSDGFVYQRVCDADNEQVQEEQ